MALSSLSKRRQLGDRREGPKKGTPVNEAARSPIGRALVPASLAWGAAAALRRRLYLRGLLPRQRAGLPIISIGALAMGGSGKTPVTMYLARLIRHLFRLRVGIVHGGYRGRARAEVLRVDPNDVQAGRWFGDEPVLLARNMAEAIVVRGPDKVAAARRCLAEGADLVLVDDGFQHLRLHRDLDVVLEAAPSAPLLAAFPRELRSSLRFASLRWWHDRTGRLLDSVDVPGSPALAPRGETEQVLAHPVGDGCHVDIVSSYEATALVDARGARLGCAEELAGRRVFLVAGIAGPKAFQELIVRCGGRVVGALLLRDHAELNERALQRALSRARHERPELVLCTEKDIVRSPHALDSVGAVAVRCWVRVLRGDGRLVARLADALGATPRS